MAFRFEWDPYKATQNLEKHQVSFDEATTVFDDPLYVTVIDDEHSVDEERYITIGLSRNGWLLILAHTDRAGLIRIISARRTTRQEQRFYEETG